MRAFASSPLLLVVVVDVAYARLCIFVCMCMSELCESVFTMSSCACHAAMALLFLSSDRFPTSLLSLLALSFRASACCRLFGQPASFSFSRLSHASLSLLSDSLS